MEIRKLVIEDIWALQESTSTRRAPHVYLHMEINRSKPLLALTRALYRKHLKLWCTIAAQTPRFHTFHECCTAPKDKSATINQTNKCPKSTKHSSDVGAYPSPLTCLSRNQTKLKFFELLTLLDFRTPPTPPCFSILHKGIMLEGSGTDSKIKFWQMSYLVLTQSPLNSWCPLPENGPWFHQTLPYNIIWAKN